MIKKFFSTGLFLQHIKPVYSFVTESPNYRRHHHSSFSTQYHTPFVRLNQKSYYSTTSTALYSSSFSSSSSTSYEIGDLVEYKDDKKYHGGEFIGKIIEKRGSGWFSIQADHKNVKSTTIKRRAKDLKLVSPSSSNDSNNNKIKEQKLDLEELLPFPPTPPLNINITDLDKILLHQNSQDDHTKTTTQASSMISSTTLSQAQYIASNYLDKKWVVFTDLHCSPSTLQTTIEILKKVHETALAHENAGVLFLGDFWHHRGSLHVPTLNAILDVLSNWTVPMIMIPGNHDQVTYKGEEHSLTPLRNAYSILDKSSISGKEGEGINYYPGPLIFSNPTKFLNAMFIPHIRDNGTMESVLSSSLSRSNETKALFIHADVTGSMMNDLIASQGGIPPSRFPSKKQIYSGHFHKPHVVNGWTRIHEIINDNTTNTTNDSNNDVSSSSSSIVENDEKKKEPIQIEYIGSPYEVSLSEAGQQKSLLILDHNWECVERIPLNIGRKHFKCDTLDEFLKLQQNDDFSTSTIKEGDRIILSLKSNDMDNLLSQKPQEFSDDNITIISNKEKFDEKVKALKEIGVKVELRSQVNKNHDGSREESSTHDEEETGTTAVEDMRPENILISYLKQQQRSKAIESSEKISELAMLGKSLIEEIIISDTSTMDDNSQQQEQQQDKGSSSSNGKQLSFYNEPTEIEFTSVTVQGFGCFQNRVEYPLDKRGLVLIKGKNKDGGSDSNGSGKSTIAFSVLWALTGSMDPRPVTSRTVDVINDNSKLAKVTLKGFLNSKPFILTRSKTSNNKSALTFLHDEKDMTRQSVKETQIMLNELFSGGSNSNTKEASCESLFARTIFHGQHGMNMNGLLEATDGQWKEELMLIVPHIDIWKQGTSLARRKSLNAKRSVSELDGMISLREGDMGVLNRRCQRAELVHNQTYQEFKDKQEEFSLDFNSSTSASFDQNLDIVHKDLEHYRSLLEKNSDFMSTLETEKKQILNDQEIKLNPLKSKLQETLVSYNNAKKDLQWTKHEIHQAESYLSSISNSLVDVKQKWESLLDKGVDVTCPTCHRSVNEDDHHSHDAILNAKTQEISSMEKNHQDAERRLAMATEKYEHTQELTNAIKSESLVLSDEFREKETYYTNNIESISDRLNERYREHTEFTVKISDCLSLLNQKNEIEQAKSEFLSELKDLENNSKLAQETLDSLREQFHSMNSEILSLKKRRNMELYNSKLYAQLTEIFGPRGIQSYILRDTINSLERSSQSYLNDLSDYSQKLEISLDSSDKIQRLAYVRTSTDGQFVPRPLSSLSGGQWKRCALALSFGFSELVSRRGKLRSSLLVLDEPLTHLDAFGRQQVGLLLKRMAINQNGDVNLLGLHFSTILVILQDLAAEELGEECFDYTDEVVKENGISNVLVDNN